MRKQGLATVVFGKGGKQLIDVGKSTLKELLNPTNTSSAEEEEVLV